jgi:hypothetical protein
VSLRCRLSSKALSRGKASHRLDIHSKATVVAQVLEEREREAAVAGRRRSGGGGSRSRGGSSGSGGGSLTSGGSSSVKTIAA